MTSILDLIDQVQAPGNVFWTNLDKEILDLVTALHEASPNLVTPGSSVTSPPVFFCDITDPLREQSPAQPNFPSDHAESRRKRENQG
ncbi:MAG: hypothetical protein BWY45_02136 [Euryarchaeota archaeon ADurb.Bin294]|nr:MAG: hypothetical protein BWY45_02136 [Euryarchaeota archaeon ADurb.Bin294]